MVFKRYQNDTKEESLERKTSWENKQRTSALNLNENYSEKWKQKNKSEKQNI